MLRFKVLKDSCHFERARSDGLFFPPNPATVVVWDSQVKDGYKRNKAPAADNNKPGDSPKRAAPVSWDGKKTSGVVEELLKNASDKAYGANSETLRMAFFWFIFSKKKTNNFVRCY